MKVLAAVLFATCMAAPAMAQETPIVEVFGGYSYYRDQGLSLSFLGPASPRNRNFHGWNAAFAGNVQRWLSVVADFGGDCGASVTDTDFSLHTFLFGPQFSYRSDRKVTVFGRILAGAARRHSVLAPTTPPSPFSEETIRDFAISIGGGLDWNMSQSVALRVIQLDGLVIPSDLDGGARLSFGVVFKFGRK